MSADSPHAIFEEIRREHAALRERLGHLHRALVGEVPDADVAALLGGLERALAAHFDNEECHGFFAEITAQAPRLAHEAEGLCSEHRVMLETAGQLSLFASSGDRSEAWRRELLARFHTFSRQLMDHESHENSLLQETYQEDIGDHD